MKNIVVYVGVELKETELRSWEDFFGAGWEESVAGGVWKGCMCVCHGRDGKKRARGGGGLGVGGGEAEELDNI